MIRHLTRLLVLCLVLSGCGERPPQADEARVLMMGDSALAWNRSTGKSVADALERDLEERVVDRSLTGARVLYRLPLSGAAGLNIAKQFRPRSGGAPWEWIVLNGGGNDLWFGCGCAECSHHIDRLITPDGTGGRLAELIDRLRDSGARVIYVGYLRSPGRSSPIESCRDIGTQLEERIAAKAERDAGFFFLDLTDLVPNRDLSFHALDRIHPSIRGSAAIAARIARLIRAHSP